MTLKTYQQEVVDEFNRWYDLLKEEQKQASKVKTDLEEIRKTGVSKGTISDLYRATKPKLVEVWKTFGGNTKPEWRERIGPDGKLIPHICIKVPTGGGKTRIAGAILKSINKKNGLVLWMVPTKAIMEQTMNILKDKTHPIRQMLDTVSNNTVDIAQKNERLSKDRLRENLCIMPLMQQSANRVKKEFLKIQRNNSIYAEFFPDTDDKNRINKLLKDHIGLDMIENTNIPLKSLVNVFRMEKPIIILDEAHKASARNFDTWAEYVNKLGPSLVIELTATPNEKESNILKVVTGKELQKESMIKKSIRVNPSELNWHGLLKNAVTRLKDIDDKARRHHRYIRPIMVIRVELTDPKLYNETDTRVHAIAAQKYLVDILGIPSEQVATKSSTVDGLKGQNLMERDSPIRYIITNNALMEGWDCPFAYMLVILDNLKSQRALTQLLGRVMRQPYTEYTVIDSLNDCYVYCIHDDIMTIIELIKKQLDDDGLTGITNYVQPIEESRQKRINKRRPEFEDIKIYLPTVYYKEGKRWTDMDYDKHILRDIEWDSIHIKKPLDFDSLERNTEVKIYTTTGDYDFIHTDVSGMKPKLFEWVSVISELVPNSWQAARIIQAFWKSTNLDDDVIYAHESVLQQHLLTCLREQIVDRSEKIFKYKLKNKIIKFDIHVSAAKFKSRGEYEALPNDGDLLQRREPKPVQLSLDEPVYKEDFDTDNERKFARYLDEAKAIEWWHRVVANGHGEYYLRGWKKNKIYPDFIAVFSKKNKRVLRIYEIKGRHLENPDTEYKQKVLGLLEETLNAGKLSVTGGTLEGDFKLVFEDEIDDIFSTELRKGDNVKAKDLKPMNTSTVLGN